MEVEDDAAIVSNGVRRIRPRIRPRVDFRHRTAPRPLDAGGPHQPGHLIAPDVVADPTCRFPQLADPVDAVFVLSEYLSAQSWRSTGTRTASRWARADEARVLASQ